MLVFIDESGDPGFKTDRGSSEVFVVAMVVFHDTTAASDTQLCVERFAKTYRIKGEVKFAKSRNETRDAFFQSLSDCAFSTRSIVVRKALVRSPNLKNSKESFYKFFVRQMMQNDNGLLQNARITIDGSGDRVFKRQLRAYLRRHLPPEALKTVQLKDSSRDRLIQLADMVAGAVARSERTDDVRSTRWREQLARNGQIQDVWVFR